MLLGQEDLQKVLGVHCGGRQSAGLFITRSVFSPPSSSCTGQLEADKQGRSASNTCYGCTLVEEVSTVGYQTSMPST